MSEKNKIMMLCIMGESQNWQTGNMENYKFVTCKKMNILD